MEEKQPPSANLPESEEEQEKVIKLLEEHLEAHDNNRKAIQEKLTEILNRLTGQIDNLEERIAKELEEKFASEEDRLQATLNELRVNSTDSALQKAKRELSTIQSYEIIENKKPNNNLTTFYGLKAKRRTVHEDGFVGLAILEMNSSANDPSNATDTSETICDSDKFTEERERLIGLLEERLQTCDDNRKAIQDKLHEICRRLRVQVNELEDRINKELEDKFILEDNRLQATLNEVRGNSTASALQKAKIELLVEQSYKVIENKEVNHDLTTLCELKAERRIIPELVEMRKPINVRVAGVNRGVVSVEFTCLNPDEERVLSDNTIVNPVKYKCMLFKKDNEQESKEYPLDKDEGNNDPSFLFTPDTLETETTYAIRAKMIVGDRESEWSDEVAEFTPEFSELCIWKKCPDYVNEYRKYSVDEGNPRVATKVKSDWYCTIIGNTYIPLNIVAPWSIKILKTKDNGKGIYIGIAPNDINQNDVNCDNGWYFSCYSSTLRSGPPHSYSLKECGPRKEDGQYVHTGDSVGVVMDTTRGDLSFVLNNVNYGVTYEEIPLDKPLVPCVFLWYQGDSVELII